MPAVAIAPGLFLDSRLALVHSEQRWLAVADLHYGYEVSQRAQGCLVPFWGMEDVAERLRLLVKDHQPETVIITGDLVHSRLASAEAANLIDQLRKLALRLVLIRGNHDRNLSDLDMHEQYRISGYRFHHGHVSLAAEAGYLDVIGHYHPCWKYHDGSGTRLRLPALIQTTRTLVLPAFSPWAAGMPLTLDEPHRVWVCSRNRVFPVPVASGGISGA
jgi:putative SbcD/Mre11-related phosphoesterase